MKFSLFALFLIAIWRKPNDLAVEAVDPGTIISAVNLAQSLSFNTANFVKNLQAKSDGSGQFIRAKFNDGCLDAGFETEKRVYTVHPNANCPPNKNLKWKFDGPHLMVEGEDSIDQPCLDCWGGYRDCDIKVVACNGRPNQRWMVRIHPRQIDDTNQRIYFSIHSDKQKGRCLTAYHGDVWVDKKYASSRVSRNGRAKRTGPSAGCKLFGWCVWNEDLLGYWYPSNQYQLEECTGNEYQSFYIDVNYFQAISSMQISEFTDSNSRGATGSSSSSTGGGTCTGTGVYKGTHDAWCRDNCAISYCPSSICDCTQVKRFTASLTSGTTGGGSSGTGGGTCRGIGVYKGTHDAWCSDNCAAGYCPSSTCACS